LRVIDGFAQKSAMHHVQILALSRSSFP